VPLAYAAGATVAVVGIVVLVGPTVIVAGTATAITVATKVVSAALVSKGVLSGGMSMGAAILLFNVEGELERKQTVPLTDDES